MHADKQYDSRGLQGTQRVTALPAGESPQEAPSLRPAVIISPAPEVVATPIRRCFTAEDKLRILKLADACTAVGICRQAPLRSWQKLSNQTEPPRPKDETLFAGEVEVNESWFGGKRKGKALPRWLSARSPYSDLVFYTKCNIVAHQGWSCCT